MLKNHFILTAHTRCLNRLIFLTDNHDHHPLLKNVKSHFIGTSQNRCLNRLAYLITIHDHHPFSNIVKTNLLLHFRLDAYTGYNPSHQTTNQFL
jgi:hypothetical protein